MHEISLVNNIFRSLEEELEPAQYKGLKRIQLKIGELSGVEPVLLENAFLAYIEASDLADIKLDIKWLPTWVHCSSCNEPFTVLRHRYICERCNRPSNLIVQGEEIEISQVEFQD
jgi:hydrogenase nickel incorporation protein HypA/HybF